MKTTIAKWQDCIQFGEDRPNPQTVLENERVRLIIAGLKPGQSIPVHPEAAAVYQFIQGKGIMTVDGEDYPVEPGSVLAMPEGAQRGLRAESEIIFLATRLAPA